MTDRLDLPTRYREQIESLLQEFVPEAEVWAYGSRVSGLNHEASDLDLVLRGPDLEPISMDQILDLEEAFERSNIPILVEARDWSRLPKSFHREIAQNYVAIQKVSPSKVKHQVTLEKMIEVNPKRPLTKGTRTPFISMADVVEHSRSPESTKIRKYKGGGARFRYGDTLLARITPCLENGKTAWVNNLAKGVTAHGSTEFIVLAARTGITHPLFIYYLARSPTFRAYAIEQMTGTSGRQRVPTEAVKAYRFELPPLEEQRRIAHVLGALDDKIELNRRMCETLEEMARALFRSWFVDFDPVRAKMEGRWREGESLPGLPAELYDHFPNRLVPSELGPIPDGWQVKMLGEIAREIRSNVHPLQSPNKVFHHFSLPAYDKGQSPIPEAGEKIRSSKTKIKPGVVLISRLNPDIERVWLADVSAERSVCSKEFLVLAPYPPLGRSYIYCLGRSESFRDTFQSLVTGTSKSHQRVRADVTLAVNVIYPSSPVINGFDQEASSLLERSLACRREARSLTALRDTLLPKLVSGEVRAGEAEALLA